jgi:hypothetical protein
VVLVLLASLLSIRNANCTDVVCVPVEDAPMALSRTLLPGTSSELHCGAMRLAT